MALSRRRRRNPSTSMYSLLWSVCTVWVQCEFHFEHFWKLQFSTLAVWVSEIRTGDGDSSRSLRIPTRLKTKLSGSGSSKSSLSISVHFPSKSQPSNSFDELDDVDSMASLIWGQGTGDDQARFGGSWTWKFWTKHLQIVRFRNVFVFISIIFVFLSFRWAYVLRI